MGSSNPNDSKSLDSEIVKLQKSTRTTVPAMLPLHDVLRARYKWYYNWHLMPGVRAIHAFILLLFLFFIGTVFYQFLVTEPGKVFASTGNSNPETETLANWTKTGGTVPGILTDALDSTYISNNANAEERLSMSDITVSSVSAVQVNLRYNTAAASSIGVKIFDGSVWTTCGVDAGPSVAIADTTRLCSGLTWNQTQINALQVSFTHKGSGATNVYSTSATVTFVPNVPTVTTTNPPSPITTTGMTFLGNITATGGENATTRGAKYSAGAACTDVTTVSDAGSFGVGAFSKASGAMTVNTQYSHRAFATNTGGTGYGVCVTNYTLANAPAAPTVNTPTGTSLNVVINENGNPSITTYTFGIDQDLNGVVDANGWVQTTGALGATESAHQTKAVWGASGKVVTGLSPGVTYNFIVKAYNGDGTGTAFSPAGSGTTGITISGTIYQANGSTPDTTGYTVAFSVNNGVPVTTTVAAGQSAFSKTGVVATAGQPIAIYLQGHANDANTVTVTNGTSDIVGLYLVVNRFEVFNHNAGTTTNANVCTQATYPAVADKLWSCSGNNITVNSNIMFLTRNNYDTGAAATLSTQGTGDLYVAGGTTTLTTTNCNFPGGVQIAATLVLAGSNNVNVGGQWNQGGTFTANTGTVTFNGTTVQTIWGTPSFNNVTLTNTTQYLRVAGNTNIGGTFTLNANTTTTVDAGVVINNALAAGTITGSGTVQVQRLTADAFVTQYKFSTYTLTNLTVDYRGTSAGGQTISDLTYGNLKISGTLNSLIQTATVGGQFNVSGTFVPGGGTITLNAGSSVVKTGTLTFYSLIVAGTLGTQPSVDFAIQNGLTINAGATLQPSAGTITIMSGTIANNGGAATNLVFYNLTSTGAVANSTSFNVANDLTVSSGTFTASGTPTYTVSGNVDFTGGGFTAGSSTLVMNGTNKNFIPNNITINNLQISGTINLMTTNLTVAGKITVDDGKTLTLEASRYIVLVANSTSEFNSTGTIAGGTNSYLSIRGNAADNLSTGGNINIWCSFNMVSGNLKIPARTYGGQVSIYQGEVTQYTATLGTGNSQTINFSSNLLIQDEGTANLIVDASTYNPSINVTGNISSSKTSTGTPQLQMGNGTWTINGNVNIAPLSINAGGSTMVLNGAGGSTQTLTPNGQTLNNLTATATAARTINFAGSSTLNVSGTWTVTGAAGQLITLGSTDANNWTINPTAANVSYVNTTKSNNNGVKFCATYSTDGTGNGGATGWFFSNGNDCRAAVVSNVSITPNSVSEITTNWTDNSTAPAPVETGFKVWVSTAAADNCSAATYNADPDYTTAADATSQNKTGLGTNTRYCTKIVPTNAFSDSDPVYAASPKYTNIDAVSGVTWGNFTTTDLAATPSNTPANLASGTSGIKYTVRLAVDDTLVEESAWQQNTNSYDPTAALSVNTRYKFEIQSRNGDGTTTAAASANKYTRANPPITAGHSSIATDSITWTWGKNSNPANTEFTLTDTAGGNCAWTADMSSCVGVGTKDANTQYTGTVTARNGDNVETTTAQASAYTAIQTPSTITAGLTTPNSIALNISDSLANLNIGSSGIQYQETTGNPGGGGEAAFTTWPQTTGTTDAGLQGAVSGAVGTTYKYKIKARNAEGVETAQSGEFTFVTTAGTQLLFELPGEILTENGSNLLSYTDPTPSNVVAGTPFNINIKAADGANYRDLAHGDTITLSSTDSQATLPAPAAMVNGSITYNGVALKTAGTQTISGTGSAGSSHEVLVGPAICSAAVSTATAAPTSLNTGASSTITVYLKDAFGNALAGHGVSAASDQVGDTISFSAATTDANGRMYVYVTSATAHVSTITISDTTDAITLTTNPQITFSAPPEDVVVENPTNFAVSAGNSKVTLIWKNPASFDHIYIYRSLISGSLGVKITEKTSNSFENTGLTNGTTYYYTLKAEKGGNLSSGTAQLSATPQKPGKQTPPSPPPTPGDTEAPSIPTNLRATSITDSSFNSIWDPSTDNVGVAGYEVYNADTNVLIGQVATAAFNTTGLTPETTYRFKVRAFDTAGNYSGFSEVLSITTTKDVKGDPDDPEEGVVALLVMGNVPKEVSAGKEFPQDIRVTAADAGGQVKTDYNKAVIFSSTDKDAKLKHDAKDPYTFDAKDAGVHSFKGSDFVLETSGKQKLTVSDNDSSSTVEIMVLSSGIINVGFEKAGQEIVDFFSNPTNVSNLNTGVVTATTALLLAPVIVNTLMSVSSLMPQLTAWFYSLLELLGIRKRRKDWGVVFNSQTGQAIPLAVIRIYDKKYNRVLEQVVADQQGRYGFLTKDGSYYIKVVKAGFTFPPKEKDSTFYEKVYSGGEFKLSEKDQSVSFNIPLDPHTNAGFAMSIWVGIVKLSKWLQKLVLPLFFIGLAVNIVILVMYYSVFYVLTLVFYVLIGILQYLKTRKARPYGKVTDVFNKPITTVIVRIYHKNNNRLVETDVTDKDGRFRFLVTPGVYYITAAKPGYVDFKSHLMYLQKEQSLVTTTIKLKKEEK